MEAAVAYIRVSSQRQVEEGGSLDSQTKQVDQYVASRGYELLRFFREEGESAKTDQRPRLQEMLRFCRDRKNQVGVVIIPRIDRLARNVTDYTNLKVQLGRLGIRLESLGERIENTPVGRFTETILASVAQFDNEIRAERSKGGMVESVIQGRWVWKAPIGYRSVRHQGKGTIEFDPHFGPIIREAFRLLTIGHQSTRAVRDFLAQSGIKRTESTFYRMIRNEAYIGRIHAFGKVFAAQPPFVPLVDELTFYKAQKALKPSNAPQKYQLESEDFPLRGTALCPCTRSYTASWTRGKQGVKYPYYRCVRCRGKSYPRMLVDGHFRLELAAYKGQEHAWDRLKELLLAIDSQVRTSSELLAASGQARVKELQDLRDAVVMKNAAGVIPDDLAMRQIERLSKEIVDAAGDIPDVAETHTAELVDFARQFFTNLHETWDGLTLKTKKDLLRFMFPEGVLFLPDRGFRNRENSLSERFKRVVSGVDLHLVDPRSEFSKTLHGWLSKLCAIVIGK